MVMNQGSESQKDFEDSYVQTMRRCLIEPEIEQKRKKLIRGKSREQPVQLGFLKKESLLELLKMKVISEAKI